VGEEIVTDFVRYATAWSAMSERTNQTAITSPGGYLYRMSERWMKPGFDREGNLAQMQVWLESSHAIPYLSIDQVGDLLWTGICDLEDTRGAKQEFDSGASTTQISEYKHTLHALLGPRLHDADVQAAIDKHNWGDHEDENKEVVVGALKLLGCDERHLREYLTLLMKVRAFPRVRPEQLTTFENRGMF